MSDVVQLQAGEASARLLPAAGGRVSALRLRRPGGAVVDILHPYPEHFFDPVRWAKGGIYPLMPYSNRIANATVQVDGEQVALQPHPDALPHTLHGNAHLLPWQMVAHDAASALLALDCSPSAAWPWHYTASMELQLAPSELRIRIELRNADTRVMPAGIGLHPYLRHEAQALLGYRATTVWPPTPEFLAGAPRAPAAGEIHWPARCLPAGGLTHYLGGWDGVALVELPERAWLQIAADASFGHLVVHRPDTLAYLCLEPVSHVADGFNLAARGVQHTGARLLAPGQVLGGEVSLKLIGET